MSNVIILQYESDALDVMAAVVNEWLENGYSLHGSPVYCHNTSRIVQFLIKNDKEDHSFQIIKLLAETINNFLGSLKTILENTLKESLSKNAVKERSA